MKIVLDIQLDGELKENDIIVYKDKKWKVVSKESFFAKHNEKQNKEIGSLKKDVEKLKKDLVNLAKIVKEK